MNLALSIGWRLRVLATVATVPPLLHVMSLHRLASRLPVRQGVLPPPIDFLAEDVDRWLRRLPWPWRWTCLKRASVLYILLRRAGIDVALHVGVRRETTGVLAAHAWLVRDGSVFLEPPQSDVSRYRMITSVPEGHG